MPSGCHVSKWIWTETLQALWSPWTQSAVTVFAVHSHFHLPLQSLEPFPDLIRKSDPRLLQLSILFLLCKNRIKITV